MANNKKVTIYSAHQPSNKDLFTEDLNKIFSKRKDTIFIDGDLNFKNSQWNLRITNAGGKTVANHSQKYKYIVTVSKLLNSYNPIRRPK